MFFKDDVDKNLQSGFGHPDTAHAHLHSLSQVLATQLPISDGNGALLYNMTVW